MQSTLVSQEPKTERAGGGKVEGNLRVFWLSAAEGWELDMRLCDYISIIYLSICFYSPWAAMIKAGEKENVG